MICLITETHANTGRNNIMAGLAGAAMRQLPARRVEIPLLFTDNAGQALLAEFRQCGEQLTSIADGSVIHAAAERLAPALMDIQADEPLVFFAYYGHPDSVLTALALKHLYPQAILVSMGYPYRGVDRFDVIGVPPVYKTPPSARSNVIGIDALPSRISARGLDYGRTTWGRRLLPDAPGPLRILSVLVGGSYAFYSPNPSEGRPAGTIEFTAEHAHALCREVLACKQQIEAGDERPVALVVTTSRRTPPEAMTIISETLGPHARYIYHPNRDGKDNPLLAMLGLADFIFITGDSTAMISDALTASIHTKARVIVYAPESLLRDPNNQQEVQWTFSQTLRRKGHIVFSGEDITAPRVPIVDPAVLIAEQVVRSIEVRTLNHAVRGGRPARSRTLRPALG